MTTDTTLITLNETQLDKLESQVRAGLDSFVKVGTALAKIRDGRGYRLRDYSTFEDYCEGVFHFTDRHGRRLIAEAQTAAKVQKVLGEAPATERAARELVNIADDEAKLQKVKALLAKKKKTVATATAEDVADAVAATNGSKRPAAGANGHQPEPEVPPEPILPVMSDICPGCHITPQSYRHSADKWLCGNCGEQVLIGVIPAKPAGCPNCNAAIVDSSGFCRNCGGAL